MQRGEQWDHTEGRWRLHREKGQLVQPLRGEAARKQRGGGTGRGEPYTRCGSYQGWRGCEGRECQSGLYFLSPWLRCRAWPGRARLEAGEPEGRAEAGHVMVGEHVAEGGSQRGLVTDHGPSQR